MTAERYAKGWSDLGMWLPDKEQCRFFAEHIKDTELVLVDRLKHSNEDVCQAAAYVLEQVGPIAKHLAPKVVEALETEQTHLIRIYLINALGGLRNDDEQVLQVLQFLARQEQRISSPEPLNLGSLDFRRYAPGR